MNLMLTFCLFWCLLCHSFPSRMLHGWAPACKCDLSLSLNEPCDIVEEYLFKQFLRTFQVPTRPAFSAMIALHASTLSRFVIRIRPWERTKAKTGCHPGYRTRTFDLQGSMYVSCQQLMIINNTVQRSACTVKNVFNGWSWLTGNRKCQIRAQVDKTVDN